MRARLVPEEMHGYSGIQIVALIAFGEFPHLKTVATLGMMSNDWQHDLYADVDTLVVDSSGNTGHAAARLAQAFGFDHVKVVIPNDIPESKKGVIAALGGVEIIEVGGRTTAAERAREEALKPGHYHLNQYAHVGNSRAHEMYTGPAIAHVLADLRVAGIAIPLGSGGTACGVGAYFKKVDHTVSVIGVRPLQGEQVPGTRDKKKMEAVVRLPWRDAVSRVEEVGRKESFTMMRRLWSAVEPQVGPSSGLAYAGLLRYLASFSPKGLERYRNMTFGFICPDDGRFYSERITGELDPDQGL
ncbi:MAG: pyridoxal-phosphate dependent enzyme [Patescibacteria group bacterium]